MDLDARRTRIHDWHVARKAAMAVFGGYRMPLWYPAGAKNEHLAVLTTAGLFDTSHMAAVIVDGPGGLALLQHAFTKDLSRCGPRADAPLAPGRCVYGAFLSREGGVVDDAIVYRLPAERFMVVVNAGMGSVVAAHLSRLGHGDAVVTDLSDRLGKLDLQGPMAARVLSTVLADPEPVLTDMPYFAFKGRLAETGDTSDAVRLVDGTEVLVSRTGYTGEFGFELFIPPERFADVWERLAEAVAAAGGLPCGLAARDSLRAGAGLPLSHQDIGPWPFVRHPWPFALPWRRDGRGFTKSFVGDTALLAADGADYTLPFAGFTLRKVDTRQAAVVAADGAAPSGCVLTCVTDMGIGRVDGRIVSVASPDLPPSYVPEGLSCGFVRVPEPIPTGSRVALRDRRREITVEIVDQIRPHRTARRPMAAMRNRATE